MMILPILCFVFQELRSEWLYSLLVFDVFMVVDMPSYTAARHTVFATIRAITTTS